MRTDGFPRVFGPYLLLSSLGRGGMGEVFLAKRHAVDDVDRLCIVKTLRGDLAEHREYVRRFMDEARIVVQLHHAHICQVIEAQAIGAEHCLAMEYVAGVNAKELAADLQQRGERIDAGLALHLISCVLDALAFAHRFKSPITGEHLRVIHRDVSPANVMVSFDGEVKLIDFGLAESTLKTEQTETRLVMGKVAYMSPEQARGETIDGSVDQFATAVMLYELVTGDRFYGDMNTHQIWQIVGRGGHVPARWLEVPDPIKNVIARALDASPARRYPSCDAMRDAVDELRARLYPRATKGQLRELMHRVYGDRADAERDLIASFADLRAPVGGLPSGNAPELSISNRIALAEAATKPNVPAPGTEPFRNSPGTSDIPAASGLVGQPVPHAPSHTMTQQVARRSTGPVEPSEALVPPRSSMRGVLAVGASLAAAALVAAFFMGRSGGATALVDAGVVARATTDAGAPAPPAIVDAGMQAIAVVTDAGAPLTVVDAGTLARADGGRGDGRKKAPKPPRDRTPATDRTPDVGSDPPPADTPVKTPTPVPPVDAAPPPADVLPERTLAENLAILRRCSRPCAQAVLLRVKPDKPEESARVADHCANGCLEDEQ